MTPGALVGVYSRITGDCFALESRNTFMLASSFSAVFGSAFELAGEQPRLEPGLEASTEPPGGGGSGGATVGAAASGGVALGVAASGGGAGSSGGSDRAMGSAAGAGEVPEPTEPARHDALRCSMTRPEGREGSTSTGWLMLALAAVLSRRRRVRSPSSVE